MADEEERRPDPEPSEEGSGRLKRYLTAIGAAALLAVWLGTPAFSPVSGQAGSGSSRAAGSGSSQPQEAPHVRPPLPSPEEIAKLPPDGGPRFNRLIHETSPYLLQHAANPVDWYPWGNEAFDKARREGKPVFLSVGYSTCHWCHVMERESFETEVVARVLNRDFVSIKVDREERPDLDSIYMNATHLLHGRGGWPNSVWLTPDRKPFYAGTYFPQASFLQLLGGIARTWKEKRPQLEAQAAKVSDSIARISSGKQAAGSFSSRGGTLERSLVQKSLASLRSSFDSSRGGFGGAPKFPPHQAFDLLFYEHARRPDPKLLEMATKTLDEMARGGVHDHVGGGFHRYSTDSRWFLPHFEKMLYDNGMLLRSYTSAFLTTGDARYRDVAERLATWVLRDMTDERGGFHSALDADSAGEEGTFYLWTPSQVNAVLGEEGPLFNQVYDITNAGNYHEESSGRSMGTNIPHLKRPLAEFAADHDLPLDLLRSRLATAREKLRVARAKRIWPGLDDKVLTAWNGYMIRGLAFAGRHLAEPRYLDAARRAASFVLSELREGGKLLRSYRAGEAKLKAYLDDYALLGLALVELHEATGEARWLQEAETLVEVLLADYRDEEAGGFYFTADDHEALLTRGKDPTDGAEPSGNGVAAQLLVRLAAHTGEERYRKEARRSLEAFRPLMADGSRWAQSLTLALSQYLDLPEELPEPGTTRPDVARRVHPVDLRLYAGALEAAPGTAIPIALELAIDQGWHVNSVTPNHENLIPTRLSLAEGSPVSLEDLRYPEAHEQKLSFDPKPLSLYEGSSWIRGTLNLPPDTPEGPLEVHLALRTQACDERRCLQPVTHDLPLQVQVHAGAGDEVVHHPQVFREGGGD